MRLPHCAIKTFDNQLSRVKLVLNSFFQYRTFGRKSVEKSIMIYVLTILWFFGTIFYCAQELSKYYASILYSDLYVQFQSHYFIFESKKESFQFTI